MPLPSDFMPRALARLLLLLFCPLARAAASASDFCASFWRYLTYITKNGGVVGGVGMPGGERTRCRPGRPNEKNNNLAHRQRMRKGALRCLDMRKRG